MAVVLDGFTAAFKRVPYIKPPDLSRMFTAIPRALITFVVNQATLSAKPTNDQQTVQVSFSLPVTFAYRMIDSQMMVRTGGAGSAGTAFDFNAGGELQITNAMRGQSLGVTTRHLLRSTGVFSFATITEQRFWAIDRNPSMILQAISAGVANVLDWRVVNNSAGATPAGTVNFLCTMYEYDIEQVQMYPPLVPVLTYSIQ